jgi:hypothetical protein
MNDLIAAFRPSSNPTVKKTVPGIIARGVGRGAACRPEARLRGSVHRPLLGVLSSWWS